MPAFCYEDVRGFHVAMYDANRVGSIKRIGDLNAQRQHGFNLQHTPRDAMLQRQAVQKLYRDEGLAVLFTDLVDRADVGMAQGRDGLASR
jgi:hypothetical protein